MTDLMLSGYRATRDREGVLTVHNVPIFAETQRGETEYTREWLEAAVAHAKRGEADSYLPPLHIYHHEYGGDDGRVKAAGFFRILGTEVISIRGEQKLAVMADLIVTCEWAQEGILAKRLPYRSVEILDVDQPALDSLALLDHEVPYFPMPMLMVSDVQEAFRGQPVVAHATIPNPWKTHKPARGERVVGCFSKGRNTFLFFQDEKTMDEEDLKTQDDPVSFQTGEEDDKDERENMQEGEGEADIQGMVESVVEAIADGSIPLMGMEKIMMAIQERQGGMMPDMPDDGAPAPAMSPGGESMSKANNQLAAAQSRLEILEQKFQAQEEKHNSDKDVQAALKRLEGRPVYGADKEAKLREFREKFGAQAFAKHVESLALNFAKTPQLSQSKMEAFSGQPNSSATPEAMAYQELGDEAVAKATTFCAEHQELVEHAGYRGSKDEYVKLQMKKRGFVLAAK